MELVMETQDQKLWALQRAAREEGNDLVECLVDQAVEFDDSPDRDSFIRWATEQLGAPCE